MLDHRLFHDDAIKLAITKDDWDQLKVGVSFQEYLSCGNNNVMCMVQTLK
jgi:hypothetical protein